MSGARWLAVMLILVMVSTAGTGRAEADRHRLLTDAGVYGTYAVVKADHDWWHLAPDTRRSATAEVKTLLRRHAERVVVDTYLLRGLSDQGDVLIRLHATELLHNQSLLVDLMATTLGRHLELVSVLHGLTRQATYVPKLAPDTQTALKAVSPPASGTYAVVIPVRKDADWWNLDEQERTRLMEAHTQAALPYLKTVSRKLYQSTGLSDFDFLTYFETVDLSEFHQLARALAQVPESRHNRRIGHPTLLGTVRPLDEVLEILAR